MARKAHYMTTQTPTAQLWIGNHEHLISKTKQELQKIFCEKHRCTTCVICQLIQKEQHYGAIWLKPEKMYTREEIQIIFNTISFKLEKNQKLFFIIQHADFLTDACANSLLKSVEEPPEGYHFIFLAERLSQILPTIQSRCIINSFYQELESFTDNPLIMIFKSENLCASSAFLKILDEEKPNEKETIEILDILLRYWLKEVKSATQENNQERFRVSQAKVEILKQAFEYSPMPGSSKIFWRNLYLQFS